MPKIQFNASAYEDFIEWNNVDKEIFDKILMLIRDISRDPFRACWGFSAGGKNEGFFRQFFSFLKAHSGDYVTEKR